jgi:hypothetical protein
MAWGTRLWKEKVRSDYIATPKLGVQNPQSASRSVSAPAIAKHRRLIHLTRSNAVCNLELGGPKRGGGGTSTNHIISTRLHATTWNNSVTSGNSSRPSRLLRPVHHDSGRYVKPPTRAPSHRAKISNLPSACKFLRISGCRL